MNIPDDWEEVELENEKSHRIFENEEKLKGVEVLKLEGEWNVTNSVPNPERGGMFDVVNLFEFEEKKKAMEKAEYLMNNTGEWAK